MDTNTSTYSPITRDASLSKHILATELRRNMTLAERKLWHALKAGRLYGRHFRRQQPMLGFVADFYCHRCRLVIEVDGTIHDKTVAYDCERDAALARARVTILRFTNYQVTQNLPFVLSSIADAAKRLDQQLAQVCH